jgi:hypothetical protein
MYTSCAHQIIHIVCTSSFDSTPEVRLIHAAAMYKKYRKTSIATLVSSIEPVPHKTQSLVTCDCMGESNYQYVHVPPCIKKCHVYSLNDWFRDVHSLVGAVYFSMMTRTLFHAHVRPHTETYIHTQINTHTQKEEEEEEEEEEEKHT